MALLRFDSLSFAYPQAKGRALSDISFSLQSGEYVVLCGESGCGKTTLLRHAKREITPSGAVEGHVYYREIEKNLSELTQTTEIGFVQQNPDDQIVTDFVWHELAFGLENMALPVQVIRRRVAEMAAFFDMESWFRKRVDELSGGQKQMLSLASVMAMSPRLLLLDEPTSMLDPLAARNLLDTVRRINKELGVAVLLTEHRLEEVFPVADRVIMMENGRIIADDMPEKVAARLSKHRDRSRLYFGLPSAVRIFSQLEADVTPLTVRDAANAMDALLDGAGPAPGRKEVQKQAASARKAKEAALSGSELWFRYSEKSNDVLRGVDLDLQRNEWLCLLGGNGAGKTTLLRVFAGLSAPYRGKVRLGKETRLVMLPQNPRALFTQDTLLRELLDSAQEEEHRVHEWVERLELHGLLDRHPYDLSGGETQRAALAKLLLRGGNALLLDEPTKGLDAYAKRQLAGTLDELTKEGKSVLMVTHDLEFAAQYAHRCALMFDGRIISEDEPHAFFAGNRFYTTAANRIASRYFPEAITCEEVVACVHSSLADVQRQRLG